ncbi:unnamed protein product [Pocillopora meandrina]|uniref:Secreted protein n=1 Tax=Pocillopora meandrina TaxID=46732 RepID=A0AAU9W185_9CNID|nr:unnamed protein product [Pocillopora meandrina]
MVKPLFSKRTMDGLLLLTLTLLQLETRQVMAGTGDNFSFPPISLYLCHVLPLDAFLRKLIATTGSTVHTLLRINARGSVSRMKNPDRCFQRA